jgi:hypothetical protein
MPTFTQIGTAVTVGALGATSIDFTAIPSTYTDLVLKVSVRSDRVAAISDGLLLKFNGSASTYSDRFLQGGGSGAPSSGTSPFGTTRIYTGEMNTNGSTASTFSSFDIYIPNYTASTNKSLSSDSVMEQNATTAYATLVAGLWSTSAAITSIQLTFSNSTTFVQYSTAYLYGVSNA